MQEETTLRTAQMPPQLVNQALCQVRPCTTQVVGLVFKMLGCPPFVSLTERILTSTDRSHLRLHPKPRRLRLLLFLLPPSSCLQQDQARLEV